LIAVSQAILDAFKAQYLPPLTREIATALCQKHEKLGWPGLLGSLDCSHWVWAKCPKSLQGQFKKGSKERPTVVYEAACDSDLTIWHCNFALPGASNDLNVLDVSPLLSNIAMGNAMSSFTVGGVTYHQPYALQNVSFY
jgi:hypothetical protein